MADEQLSQVDVDKVDHVVEQIPVEGNTVGETASNSQAKWGYMIDLEWGGKMVLKSILFKGKSICCFTFV